MTNEEFQNEIDSITQALDKAEYKLKSLENSTTISSEVERAFRIRLKLNEFIQFQASTKTASSENQVVDESGASTYSVLKPPDGWEQRVVNGALRYYPFWT